MKRILGIDYGERRVGIAVSDELGITAQGLETFDRKTGDVFDHLGSLIDQYEVGEVVVGNPVSMSGRPNQTSLEAQRIAGEIESRFGVRVVLWDERLTSAEARRTVAGSKSGRKSGKKAIDRVAAVLILQGYLESQTITDD
jgi:putative Holliday junction resolvase